MEEIVILDKLPVNLLQKSYLRYKQYFIVTLNDINLLWPDAGIVKKQPTFAKSLPKKVEKTKLISKLTLSNNDKNLLNKFIVAELELYNLLVDGLSAAANRAPEAFYELTEQHAKLFGLLCAEETTIQLALKNEKFKEFNELLLSLPESTKILFETAKIRSSVLSFTKKNLAYEMFNFFVEYCLSKQASKSFSTTTISKLSIYQKRHLQINKKSCRVVYDKKSNSSVLYIPHLLKPVCTVKNVDLTKFSWSIVVIHQKPNVNPDVNTEWVAEFKPSRYKYIMKYLDCKK